MTIDWRSVAPLQEAEVHEGEIWVYVADFNVGHEGSQLKSTDRIDAEVPDVRYILEQGGVVAFLAHKGRFSDDDTEDLDFVLPHLSAALGTEVAYCPENATQAAIEFVQHLRPGTAAVMGNTRAHEGEERNDPALAAQFARLGRFAAIGGFGKAHRAHASNVGIQEHLTAYAPQSQLAEMALLAPWAGADPGKYSVAVLGGVKKEKIVIGLTGFVQTYDAIIPGGIVLNTVLRVSGHESGASLLQDGGKTFEREVREVLGGPYRSKIHVPAEVIVARPEGGGFSDAHRIRARDGVAEGYMIVDYLLPGSAIEALGRMAEEKGRLVLAGTPGIYTAGFRSATDAVLASMRRNPEHCVVLGGDTAAEVSYEGPTSTGGGSALYFVVKGTTPVFEALKTNKLRFQH